MKSFLLFLLVLPLVALADTPPPGTVKAKTYSGDGATPITSTGASGALDVNVTNSGGLSTVNQGTAGLDPWLVHFNNTSLTVTGTFWQATQPVSGTFWQATQPVSLVSLPSLAAGSNLIGSVGINGSVAVTGTFWQATQPVSAASLPLPSGAATSANQTTEISSLATIATNTTNAGTPVVSGTVTVNQGTQGVAAWPVLAAQAGSWTSTVTQATGSNLHVAVDSAPTTTVTGTVTANAGTGTFTVDGSGHTQPVSGTVTANIGTSGSLALNATVAGLQVAQGSTTSGQSGGLALGAVTTAAPTYTTAQSSPFSLTTTGALRIDGSSTTQPVSGTFWQATQPVSGTFFQATQPVSLLALPSLAAGSAVIGHVIVDTAPTTAVTGTFWQTTQPVSIATAPALVAGSAIIGKVGIDQTTPGTTNLVALAANQSVNTAQINGVTPLMGNGATGTGSQRVTIASDNTAFSVNAIPKTAAALTVKQAAITVGTSAVRLTNDGSAPPSTRVLMVAQLLSTSTANCYFGSSGVTSTSTTRGVQMFAGQTLSFNNDAGDYYAICDTSSQTIFITEQE